MFVLKFGVLLALIGKGSALCAHTSWWDSFNSPGQSKCNEANFYINGLSRNEYKKDDQLTYLEGVQCCSAPSQWSNGELQVVYADWVPTLYYKYNTWANCPTGFFLQGLLRTDSGWPWYAGYLYHIETARCTKPAEHPFYYGDCYSQDINFNENGLFSCNEGYYVKGLYKGNCDYLHCIDKLYCCKMADKPEIIDDVDKLKTKIMDTTLTNLANLADKLGYGYCYGTKGVNVGEDFRREHDSWVANTEYYCKGDKCDKRLAIDYRNWNLAVKEIKYGQKVIDKLNTENIESGQKENHLNTSSTVAVERSYAVMDTIEHSMTSSWKTSLELSFSLEFGFKETGKASSTFKVAFEYSQSTTKKNSQTTSHTLKTTSTQTIPPHSAAEYTIKMSKTRTTIPYTAVIIAKFSVGLRGFLRFGQGFSSPTTNYHFHHKGSDEEQSVPYTFGSQSEAFYTALKRESETQSKPWLWNDMFKNHPSVRHVINKLTNESQYEFTLNGKLEHVAGTKIDITWKKVELKDLNRRSVLDESKADTPSPNNITIFATVGPKDKPVDVEYPEVHLGNADQVKLETGPVNQNSS
uniref:Aerolysin-like C-terminal domain-containing protein n=1 Tax=Biomphalaria glabrata TaxID=6526 RepID=A0A2C9KLY1_BIOGL